LSSVKITELTIIPELLANSQFVVDDVSTLTTHSVDGANLIAFTGNAYAVAESLDELIAGNTAVTRLQLDGFGTIIDAGGNWLGNTAGLQGFTGSAGLQGNIGFVGSAGVSGFTGSAGDQGFTGSRGLAGITISETEPEDTEVLWLDESDTSAIGIRGIPAGGLEFQTLAKNSDADYDVKWGVRIIVSDTPPEDPLPGDIWVFYSED
jgi:hypothetical protein